MMLFDLHLLLWISTILAGRPAGWAAGLAACCMKIRLTQPNFVELWLRLSLAVYETSPTRHGKAKPVAPCTLQPFHRTKSLHIYHQVVFSKRNCLILTLSQLNILIASLFRLLSSLKRVHRPNTTLYVIDCPDSQHISTIHLQRTCPQWGARRAKSNCV